MITGLGKQTIEAIKRALFTQENEIEDHENRIQALESGGGVPHWVEIWENTKTNPDPELHDVFVNGTITLNQIIPTDASVGRVTFLDSSENEFSAIFAINRATETQAGHMTAFIAPYDFNNYHRNVNYEPYITGFQFHFIEAIDGTYSIYLKSTGFDTSLYSMEFETAGYAFYFDEEWYISSTSPIPKKIEILKY